MESTAKEYKIGVHEFSALLQLLIKAHLRLRQLFLQQPELLPQVTVLSLQVHTLILELVLLSHHSYE